MSLLDTMLRNEMRRRALYGRRRRSGFFGSPYGYGWGRPRRRTNVRVGGCCLPIPIGVMTAGALGARFATRRYRA